MRSEFDAIPLDGCGEIELKHFRTHFVLVAVTTFTHTYLSALITLHWKVLRS